MIHALRARGRPHLLLLLMQLLLPLACGAAGAADDAAAESSTKPPPDFEGAVGAVVSWQNEYLGGASHRLDVAPAFYLRYKRISISHASGFVTRRQEELPLGLGLELVRRSELRMNLGLRIDRGRDSSVSGALAGIDDVRTTVRMRTGAIWQIDEHWKATAGWTIDLLGRGGGATLDAGIGHELQVGRVTWWTVGATLSWGNARYMRSWFGVTPQASAASGYAVYAPGAGLRDVSVGTSLRTELGSRWSAYVGGGAGRIVGPAADSPLTKSVHPWWIGAGVARRF